MNLDGLTLRDFMEQMEDMMGGWLIVQDVTENGLEYRDGCFYIVDREELSNLLRFGAEDCADIDEDDITDAKNLEKLADYYLDEIEAIAKYELPDIVLQKYPWVTKNSNMRALLRIAVVKPEEGQS